MCLMNVYLDGQCDVCIGTEATPSVAGAVVEASSWETEKALMS